MNAFATLGFHPQLLAYAAVLMMYTLVLVEARRVWCAVRLDRDVGRWWVYEDGFPRFMPLAVLSYTIFTALVCVGSMSALFSLAFLPVALLSGAALWAMGWGLTKVREKTAGDDRWPPIKLLHEATSFFAGMTDLFGGANDDSTGGLMALPLLCTLYALCGTMNGTADAVLVARVRAVMGDD